MDLPGVGVSQEGGGGGGGVTSVGLALPVSEFNVSGTPVINTGTLTGAWKSQSQNLVFASPNGSAGVPSFRALTVADVSGVPSGSGTLNTVPKITNATGPVYGDSTITDTGAAVSMGDPLGGLSTFQLFVNQGGASWNSNAGLQFSSTTGNRAQFRGNQFGANTGCPGITGFKSRGVNTGDKVGVVDGDVLFRATAIGVAPDNASIPLAGYISIVVPTGGSAGSNDYVATDFEIQLVKLAGPINSIRKVFRVTSEGAVEFIDASSSPLSAAGTGQIHYNNGSTRFEFSVNGGAWTPFGTVLGSGTINAVPKWNSVTGLTDSIIADDGVVVSIGSATSSSSSSSSMSAAEILHVYGSAVIEGELGINSVTYSWPAAQGGATTFLMNNGSGSLSWAAIPIQTSTLLNSAVHTDVVTGTPVRGDLIVANATPNWTKLAKGTQYQVLLGGLSDPGWGAVDLSQSTAITGTLGISNGGTGQTTKAPAFNALSPLSTKGDVIAHDGSNNVRVAVSVTNGQALVAASGATPGVKWDYASVPTGNMLWVDAVNGNDTTGTRGDASKPYLTVEKALTVASSGDTVVVRPGTYTLSTVIAIPSGVTLKGESRDNCILQMSVATATTMVTMGTSTRLSSLTLKLTNITSAANIVGVLFGGTTLSTAVMWNCRVIVDGGALTGNNTGVLIQSTGSPLTDEFNNVDDCIINVESTGAGGVKRGILMDTSAGTAIVFGTTVTCIDTSTADVVGAELNIASGTLLLKACDVTGSGGAGGPPSAADIKNTTVATGSNLQLEATDLDNSTAHGFGFTAKKSSQMLFGFTGSLPNSGNYYLTPASYSGTAECQFRVCRACVIKGLAVKQQVAPTNPQTVTYTVRKNGVDTTLTVQTTSAITSAADTTHSVNFAIGDLLSVKMAPSGTAGGATPGVSLEMV